MSKIHGKRLLVLLALVIVVCLLPPIIWGEPRTIKDQVGGNGWRNFIYDFQTLLTGILAVGAAWWNIGTMKSVDGEAARRHGQILEEARKKDALVIERAINPQALQLRACLDMISRHRRDVIQGNTLAKQFDNLNEYVPFFSYSFEGLNEILSRRQLDDGMRLFDGELTYRITVLQGDTLRAIDAAKTMRDPPTGLSFMNVDDRARSELYSFLSRSEMQIQGVITGLERVAANYKVRLL